MSKLPQITPKKLLKVFIKQGFMIKRQTGSHRVYHNFKSEKTTVVPFHSKDIPQGTLRSIIKQTGLNENIFLKK